MYKLEFTKQAQKDIKIAVRAGYENQVKEMLETVREDPFKSTQQFERLLGNLSQEWDLD
jgi:Txe/YoeB family toxin of Txe-Axe toxin-antitoxin module